MDLGEDRKSVLRACSLEAEKRSGRAGGLFRERGVCEVSKSGCCGRAKQLD